jgi:hypothetical protein
VLSHGLFAPELFEYPLGLLSQSSLLLLVAAQKRSLLLAQELESNYFPSTDYQLFFVPTNHIFPV